MAFLGLCPTVGEGTIIVRSDPDAGLEGLNRDIEKAREITKNEEKNLVIYISPSAIQEITDGFGGIINDFGDLLEVIKNAVPNASNSVEDVQLTYGQLRDAGLTDMQAAKVINENPLLAQTWGKLESLPIKIENMSEEQAQVVLKEILTPQELALIAPSAGDGMTAEEEAQYIQNVERLNFGNQHAMGALVSAAISAESSAVDVLQFCYDCQALEIYLRTNGAAGKEGMLRMIERKEALQQFATVLKDDP